MDVAGRYFEQFRSFETAQLYITHRTDDVRNEIYHNCLYFDLKVNHSGDLSEAAFARFLSIIKTNRQAQWKAAAATAGMIYYIWFDEMAGQLRINFINSNHSKLPFGCAVEFVADEKEIINLFLNSTNKGTISLSALKDPEGSESTNAADAKGFILKVYQETFIDEI